MPPSPTPDPVVLLAERALDVILHPDTGRRAEVIAELRHIIKGG